MTYTVGLMAQDLQFKISLVVVLQFTAATSDGWGGSGDGSALLVQQTAMNRPWVPCHLWLVALYPLHKSQETSAMLLIRIY